jgi:hypothetical protein
MATELNISETHNAVIKHYGFDVKRAGGKDMIAVIDPTTLDKMGKFPRYVGRNLEDLLQKAVIARRAAEDNKTQIGDDIDAESNTDELDGRSDDLNDETHDDTSDDNARQDVSDDTGFDRVENEGSDVIEYVELDGGDNYGGTMYADEIEDAAEFAAIAADNVIQFAPSPNPAPAAAPMKPVRDVTPKKDRKPNRYMRAARIIAKNPTIDVKDLAKKAEMTVSTAGHCLDAWEGIVGVLNEIGWLTSSKKAAE